VYDASSFLLYTMTVSPRFDTIVFVIPGVVENALGRLIASHNSLHIGMPGLRVESGTSGTRQTFHLRHLPTSARAVMTEHSDFGPALSQQDASVLSTHSWPTTDIPMSDEEKDALRRIPTMSPDIEILLGALVSRLDLHSPDGTWDLGMWNWDRLDRLKPHRFAAHQHQYRSLWGVGQRWHLRWNRNPHPDDVVACLTDRKIGVDGARALKMVEGIRINLRSSTLDLQYGAPPGHQLRSTIKPLGRRN
jgi:hypothetical protein